MTQWKLAESENKWTFMYGSLDSNIVNHLPLEMILGEIDLTMLHQICRRGHLSAFLNSISSGKILSGTLQSFSKKVFSSLSSLSGSGVTLLAVPDNSTVVNNHGLPPKEYTLLLIYINTIYYQNSPLRHYKILPHPDGSKVHSPKAEMVKHISHYRCNYSISALHCGNSSIAYQPAGGGIDAGFITSMWWLVLDGTMCTFVIVAPHKLLSNQDEKLSPYSSHPGFRARLVYTASDPEIVIELDKVISHIVYHNHPPYIFNISQATTVLVNSLYRNQDNNY